MALSLPLALSSSRRACRQASRLVSACRGVACLPPPVVMVVGLIEWAGGSVDDLEDQSIDSSIDRSGGLLPVLLGHVALAFVFQELSSTLAAGIPSLSSARAQLDSTAHTHTRTRASVRRGSQSFLRGRVGVCGLAAWHSCGHGRVCGCVCVCIKCQWAGEGEASSTSGR